MKIKDKNSAWFKRYDLTGQRFSQLKVLSFSHFAHLYDKGGKRRSFFLCKCDCGNEIVLPGIKLKNGNNKSCGCINTPKYPIDETYFEKIDTKSENLFVAYASTDSDALKAALKFSKLGIQQVFYLEGGIKSWVENNMPLTGED